MHKEETTDLVTRSKPAVTHYQIDCAALNTFLPWEEATRKICMYPCKTFDRVLHVRW